MKKGKILFNISPSPATLFSLVILRFKIKVMKYDVYFLPEQPTFNTLECIFVLNYIR